jgi:ATP-dependent RNA helicase DDX46/PRP5
MCCSYQQRRLLPLQVRGKNVPRPVRNWNQCGLSSRVVDTLRKAGMTEPMPIQVRADSKCAVF